LQTCCVQLGPFFRCRRTTSVSFRCGADHCTNRFPHVIPPPRATGPVMSPKLTSPVPCKTTPDNILHHTVLCLNEFTKRDNRINQKYLYSRMNYESHYSNDPESSYKLAANWKQQLLYATDPQQSNEKLKTNTVQTHPHRSSRCTSIYSPDFRSHSSQPNTNHLISYNNILLLYSQIPVAGLGPL
jgi:hypothetical protein